MSYRTTLVLLVVFIVFGGAVYFLELRDKGQGAEATPKADQLRVFDLDDGAVRRLSVTWNDRTVTVERPEDGDWQLQPEGVRADQLRVSQLVFRLSRLRAVERVNAGDADLGSYGLAQPALKVTMELPDVTAELLVGAKAPLDMGYYARRADGGEVYVVDSRTVSDLQQLVEDPPRERPTPTPGASPTAGPSPTTSPSPTATPTPGSTAAPSPAATALPAPQLPATPTPSAG
mgnify:CR=1 FL=1